MGKFVEIPSFNIHTDDGGLLASEWVLEERLVYTTDDPVETVVVPAGFRTDLASIPRLFRGLLPQNDKHRLAAVVHDWLCRTAHSRKERARGDRIFREAMKDLGVPAWKRWVMWGAVRSLTAVKRKFP